MYFKLNIQNKLKSYEDVVQMRNLGTVGNHNVKDFDECELGAKIILNGYYSVEFNLNGKGPSYLFKLRNKTSNKPYILVKKDSSVFNGLKVGDILDMEYNQSESSVAGKLFKTLITSKIPHDRYTGYSIVELSIIDN
jgi:hypothetical protein